MKQQIKQAQKEYMRALASFQASQQIDKEAKEKVLSENIFVDEETGERLIKAISDFRMSDADFSKYIELCATERVKLGLDIPAEYTADYQTRPALKEAENKLIEIAVALTPKQHKDAIKKASRNWKYREELIDLTLRLAL